MYRPAKLTNDDAKTAVEWLMNKIVREGYMPVLKYYLIIGDELVVKNEKKHLDLKY